MIDKRYNIFEAATELISLDCSSITAEAFSICHNTSHSLQQSILNLKSVLPTFTSQFNLFKQEIIEMSYLIVNKLMSVIKAKTMSIAQLENDLVQSQSLNKSMKKQVIQLQEMIVEFMESYKKQILIKQKQINQKQKEVDDLKNVLKQNFNSPRNTCINCEQKINHTDAHKITNQKSENSKQFDGLDFKLKHFFTNSYKSQEILIQNEEQMDCKAYVIIDPRKSLEIIQEENSEVTSLTDYLQSQRCSQKENTSQSIGEIIRSARSGQDKQKLTEEFYTGKRSTMDLKNVHYENPRNSKYLNDCDKATLNYQSPVGKINSFLNLQNKNIKDNYSSRQTNQNSYQQNPSNSNKKERRNSQILPCQKILSEGFKIQRKPQQRTALASKMPQDKIISSHQQAKQQLSLKAQLQQISKSSSCNDLYQLGDSQKINVNLPKKFQSPKNMNFLKQSHPQKKDRLRTESSPRNQKHQINKENIHIQYQPKPNEMGRKIMARKKMIMTHAKASTSRIQTKKPLKEQCAELIQQPAYENFTKKKTNFIQIKLIDSPQKQPSKSSHLLKPAAYNMFSVSSEYETGPRKTACMDYSSVNSNISAINESAVKTHHMYHSSDKYQSAETPKNIHKITMTPGKLQSKGGDRKSISKSKQKLKVMSKSVNQDHSMSIHHDKQSKEKFLTQMNSNFFSSCNNQSISKLNNRNLSVKIGNTNNNKVSMKQNLVEIKNALINYDMNKIFKSLKEVYFDGKMINGMKEGMGKVVYDNGIIYEGMLKEGKKEGEGKLSVNGVIIFEGNFVHDSIEGQGYLKFLKYFTHSSHGCPKALQNASYYGMFGSNQFNGMGTLFLNDKQKIVTKFSKGVPSGELTFYTENNIQFAHWPID